MSTEITINQDIVEINVTEQVVTIEAPSGAYPLPSMVSSVFGRVGNVVAQEGDYTLTQIGDVTLTSPSNGQVLKYNGTAWVNSSDTDTGLTSVGLSMPSAFSVANSPLTANGTLSVTGAGTTAQYVRGDGSLATLPSLTGFVPYTGATADVDLGTFNLTADVITGATGSFASSGGSNTFAINHSSGSGIALNITKGGNGEGLYINKTSGSGNAATIIGTLNATTLVKSGGTSSQYLMADGSVSTLTNPVTGTGTTNTLPKFTGASTIGNSNVSDSGSLITLGSNSFLNGSVGIGATIATGTSLNIGKTITGSTDATGLLQQGNVLSDVTTIANGFLNILNTQAASFTLSNYFHFRTTQGTIGAGSTITLQVGFLAGSALTGATTNYGFRGSIPVGTGRWNLFMDGMAANFLAGDTGIGTQTLGTATALTIGGTETAVSAISRGQLINTTLVASANGDALVGLDIAPTFTAGAFTGVTPYNLRISSPSTNGYSIFLTGNASINGSNQMNLLRGGANVFSSSSIETTVSSFGASTPLKFSLNSNATIVGQFFGTTGNFTLQNGGTFTDAGYRLDVNGTTRFIGTATITGSTTAASAIARGVNITSTLVAAANNDVLVGLDINSTPSVGAFTGVQYSALRVNGNVLLNANSINIVVSPNGTGTTNESLQFNAGRAIFGYDATIGGAYVGTYAARPISFLLGTSTMGRFFATTGNLTLQNGGTYTDIPTARLAVNSTTQGFLPPRMTTTEKNAIASPATGLVVFDTTLGKLCVFATTWQTITSV